MLTVDTLVAGLGLELSYAAGAEGATRPLSWAHVVDLPDPWNWIGPGELILTTGTGIPDPTAQTDWIDQVIASGAGALLLAPRPGSEPLSAAALARADRARFPILTASFDARFTEIAREVINATLERESRRLASAQRVFTLYAASLAREEHWSSRLAGIARRLGLRAELRTAGANPRTVFDSGLTGALADGPAGDLADGFSRESAMTTEAAPLRPWPVDAEPLLLAVEAPDPERVARADAAESALPSVPADDATRRSFATVFAIELMLRRREAIAAAEKGGVLAELWVAGSVADERLAGIFPQQHADDGIPSELRFFVVPSAADSLEIAEALRSPECWETPFAAFTHGPDLAILLADAEAARDAVLGAVARVTPRLGIGPIIDEETGPAESLRLAALAASRSSEERSVVSGSELRASDLIIPATRAHRAAIADALLGPLARHDRERGTELLPTLSSYFDEERSQTRTAKRLGIHRHTLDHRLRAIESILGMHPAGTAAIAQLWIAFEARRLGDWTPDE